MTGSRAPRALSRGAWERIKGQIRVYALDLRRERACRHLWADAESFEQLCALMQRFVRGELENWPGHGGPCNEETIEIAEALAHANGAGFLTTTSQPGCSEPMVNKDGSAVECGASWDQRAAVEGHATHAVLDRINEVCRVEHLRVQAHRTAHRRRTDYSQAVTVTMVNGREHTGLGARLSRRDVESIWAGIEDHLMDEILGMWQVTIYDERWGTHTLLWERLMLL